MGRIHLTLLGVKHPDTGSKEEEEAILTIYTSSNGSLDAIYEHIMLSNPIDDEDRFRKIIKTAIEDGRVEAFDSFTHETIDSRNKRKKAAAKESSEAIEYAKELGVYDKIFGSNQDEAIGGGIKLKQAVANAMRVTDRRLGRNTDDVSSLQAVIKARGSNRMGTLIEALEAKYTTKGNKKPRPPKRYYEEPSEEEFQKIRTNLQAHAKNSSKRYKQS